jgi:hypothetical protein
VLLELPRQKLVLVHSVTSSRRRVSRGMTDETEAM